MINNVLYETSDPAQLPDSAQKLAISADKYKTATRFGLTGCERKDDDCVQRLTERIQVGASQSQAEEVLDQCGFIHSFDQKTSMIYALKQGDKSGLVKQDWSAQIKLDEGRKVASVKVEKLFTGP